MDSIIRFESNKETQNTKVMDISDIKIECIEDEIDFENTKFMDHEIKLEHVEDLKK